MATQLHSISPDEPGRGKPATAPSFVPIFNTVVRRLMRVGVPFGPNVLLSVRGRKSGEVRTTPVAVVEIGGRRWVQSPYGNVNWVQNLRAAGEAVIIHGRRREAVRAVELTTDQAATFYRDTLAPYARRIPFGPVVLGSVLGARDVFENPDRAAQRYPAFELFVLNGKRPAA